jgi:hypothetical protein
VIPPALPPAHPQEPVAARRPAEKDHVDEFLGGILWLLLFAIVSIVLRKLFQTPTH